VNARNAEAPRYNLSNPRRVASATASVRPVTFILAKIAFPWDLTVLSLMKRIEAISLLLFPTYGQIVGLATEFAY
jgi:hypothetical protein